MLDLTDEELMELAQEDARGPMRGVDWWVDKLLPKDKVTIVFTHDKPNRSFVESYMMITASDNGANISYYDFQNIPQEMVETMESNSPNLTVIQLAASIGDMISSLKYSDTDIIMVSPAEYVLSRDPRIAREIVQAVSELTEGLGVSVVFFMDFDPGNEYVHAVNPMDEKNCYVISPFAPTSVVYIGDVKEMTKSNRTRP